MYRYYNDIVIQCSTDWKQNQAIIGDEKSKKTITYDINVYYTNF